MDMGEIERGKTTVVGIGGGKKMGNSRENKGVRQGIPQLMRGRGTLLGQELLGKGGRKKVPTVHKWGGNKRQDFSPR